MSKLVHLIRTIVLFTIVITIAGAIHATVIKEEIKLEPGSRLLLENGDYVLCLKNRTLHVYSSKNNIKSHLNKGARLIKYEQGEIFSVSKGKRTRLGTFKQIIKPAVEKVYSYSSSESPRKK